MHTRSVDVAVIGAGTAGLSARREAVKAGATTVMIESGPYGTTCARVGCMPSKLLIAAADVAHEIAGAAAFGIDVPSGARIDGRRVLERVRRERDRFVGFVLEATEAIPSEQRLLGHARFIGPTTLQIDDHTRVDAKAVVIAAGSEPWVPPPLEAVRDRVLVNDDVFELRDLPASIAVVGTGIIGLELGQALHRLGVRTEFFSHSTALGPISDPEVRDAVRASFGRELSLHLDVNLRSSQISDGKVLLRWADAGGTECEGRFACVLAAAGRRPRLAGLDLDRAGVEFDQRGVPMFDPHTMQCSDRPIFIAGDVAADRPLLHEAADEGTIAGRNAARYPAVHAGRRRTPLAIVFTDPQMATVGVSYGNLDRARIEIGTVSYEDQGRARVMGKTAGLVRVYADRDRGELIGAEMFGPRVENTAHLLAWAIQARVDVEQSLGFPFYHPVVEEGIRTALRDLCGRLKIRSVARALDLECGPGV
jgi:dihydrolipoamide dehydrogenase